MPSRRKKSVSKLKSCKKHQCRTITSPRRCINRIGSTSKRKCSPSRQKQVPKQKRKLRSPQKSIRKSPQKTKPRKPRYMNEAIRKTNEEFNKSYNSKELNKTPKTNRLRFNKKVEKQTFPSYYKELIQEQRRLYGVNEMGV